MVRRQQRRPPVVSVWCLLPTEGWQGAGPLRACSRWVSEPHRHAEACKSNIEVQAYTRRRGHVATTGTVSRIGVFLRRSATASVPLSEMRSVNRYMRVHAMYPSSPVRVTAASKTLVNSDQSPVASPGVQVRLQSMACAWAKTCSAEQSRCQRFWRGGLEIHPSRIPFFPSILCVLLPPSPLPRLLSMRQGSIPWITP